MLSFAPLDGAVSAASVALDHLAALLAPVGGTATAIVLFTVAVRLALHPLTRRAVRGERARLRLAPQVTKLRERHARDPQRLAAAVTDLHRDAGVSPFAGMLPTLAQAPAFLVLYQLSTHLHDLSPHLPDAGQTLFGVGLGARLISTALPQMWPALLLVAALTGVAWLTSRRAARLAAIIPGPAPSGLLGRLPRLLPYATPVTALFLPLATLLYLLTSSAWTLAENTLLHRGLLT